MESEPAKRQKDGKTTDGGMHSKEIIAFEVILAIIIILIVVLK